MRILIILLYLTHNAANLFAQERNDYKWMPTMEVGVNVSNQQIRRNADMVFDQRNGLRAALIFEKPHSKRLTFLGSFSYVQSGSNNVLYSNESEKLEYAEISIKAKEYLPIGGSDLFLSLGPYFSYGINGVRISANGETESNNLFKQEGYNVIEWGLGGNLGFKFPWGTYLQAGLQTAFSNCYESDQTQMAYFNYSLMLTAGHSIGWRAFRAYKK
jgi:hypothetical protein